LRRFENREDRDRVEIEERPFDRHNGSICEAARFIVVFHHGDYPWIKDGSDTRDQPKKVVAEDWSLSVWKFAWAMVLIYNADRAEYAKLASTHYRTAAQQ
jgi:hypothetical protein